jgi:hypothetical protein
MKRLSSSLILVFAALSLSACALAGAADLDTGPTPQEVGVVEGCPSTTEGTQLLMNSELGYCLLYPTGYDVLHPHENETVLTVGSLLNVDQPRVYVEVKEAAGHSVEQIADKLGAEVSAELPVFEIRQSRIILAGEEAIVLDNMPGQDVSRRVVVIHNGRLYRLTFILADRDARDAYTQMEKLYTTVTDSFNFLPTASSIVTPTIEIRGGEEPALIWERRTRINNGGEYTCSSLLLAPNNQALIGPCGSAQTPVRLFAHRDREWAEILARFAPFQYNTSREQVTFQGRGQIAGPAWRRAITAWARFSYSELSAGRFSASPRTVLSWWLGEFPGRPDKCAHLTVLDFGYAYAESIPCQGGDVQNSVGAWLETRKWERFDAWLYSRAPVYQGNNYFSGEGAREMTEAEIIELSDWAETVYHKIGRGL